MLITQADWARRHGFSRQYVSRLVARGAVRLVDGKIDPAQADAALAALRQPAKPLRRSGQGAPSSAPSQPQARRSGPADAPPFSAGASGDLPTLLLKTRIKSEAERGKLLELEAKAEAGKLLDADEVKAAAFNKARTTRDRLLNIPDRMAAVLAAESGVRKVHERIARLAIDSGYATQEVYGWVRNQPRDRVMAVKGTDGFNKSVPVSGPTYVDATDKGRKLRRGAAVWTVCSAVFKSELYGWLRLERPTEESAEAFPPGFVHLPEVDEEYLKQLTAERLVERKDRRGFRRLEWEKTRERNEALDARVYARAAAWLERLDAMDSRAVIRRAARHRVAEAPPVMRIDERSAVPTQTPPSGGIAVSGLRRREWLDRRRGWLR